jgi:competence protein ComEC
VVIDAGPRTDHFDAGRRVVAPFLVRQGVHRLSALIVSHAHADHLGGVEAVLERIPADLVLEPGELIPDPLYLGFLDDLAASATPWRAVRAGDAFELDSVRFQVLHPDTSWAEWGWDLNEDSVVLLVRYRGFEALFAGDAGLDAEQRLRGRVGRVDILKVGHHGSRSATSDSWLAELAPKAAVISVGEGNRYGHPAPEALQRLAAHGVEIWRTDRDGMVSVETDGRRMTIRAAGREETKLVE